MKRFVLLSVIAFIACAALWGKGSQDSKAIEAMKEGLDQYCAFLLAGDLDSWGNLHTEDVVKMPPDEPAVLNRKDLIANNKATLKVLEFTGFNIKIEKSEVHGDLGLSWGVYTWTARMKSGGEKLSYDGKFLTIYKKQSDGRWLIAYDCFNSNVPPKGAM